MPRAWHRDRLEGISVTPTILKEPPLPTDYAKLSENLSKFYNFTNKVVLFIGAGGVVNFWTLRPEQKS